MSVPMNTNIPLMSHRRPKHLHSALGSEGLQKVNENVTTVNKTHFSLSVSSFHNSLNREEITSATSSSIKEMRETKELFNLKFLLEEEDRDRPSQEDVLVSACSVP